MVFKILISSDARNSGDFKNIYTVQTILRSKKDTVKIHRQKILGHLVQENQKSSRKIAYLRKNSLVELCQFDFSLIDFGHSLSFCFRLSFSLLSEQWKPNEVLLSGRCMPEAWE
jgi:hypothetical protein